MEPIKRIFAWASDNTDIMLDVLRFYLGIALLVRGGQYIADIRPLLEQMEEGWIPLGSVGLAHLIAIVHIAGGFLLALGIATRLVAALQVPILLGAVLFVGLPAGITGPRETLQLSLLTLLILCLLVLCGGGRLSVDGYLERSEHRPRWYRRPQPA